MISERLEILPHRVSVDLDGTMFWFRGESEATESIQSAELIKKTADLVLLLSVMGYSLSIYTAAHFFRPRYIAKEFPEMYGLFDEVYTRESLINDDAPPDATVFLKRQELIESREPKWHPITVPAGLSKKDLTTVQWVAKNRGKAPALIGASVIIDDGRKVRQLGDAETRVIVVKPDHIPIKDISQREFIKRVFP